MSYYYIMITFWNKCFNINLWIHLAPIRFKNSIALWYKVSYNAEAHGLVMLTNIAS